jgi:(4S)-4-hydroxy-5-phosphonooxypentane-2,3-dione isomerase
MNVNIVKAYVKKEYIEQFIEATRIHHANTIKEEGNIRFDFLQSRNDPALFLFYEAYESDEAITAHREHQSYLTWRKTVADWMAKPREGSQFKAIAPEQIGMWKYASPES